MSTYSVLNTVTQRTVKFSVFIKLSSRIRKESRNKIQIFKSIRVMQCWEENEIRKWEGWGRDGGPCQRGWPGNTRERHPGDGNGEELAPTTFGQTAFYDPAQPQHSRRKKKLCHNRERETTGQWTGRCELRVGGVRWSQRERLGPGGPHWLQCASRNDSVQWKAPGVPRGEHTHVLLCFCLDSLGDPRLTPHSCTEGPLWKSWCPLLL